MNVPIASPADLAGDRAVIAGAEAIRADVATASNDIEDMRRLPPALLDRLHDAQLFRLLLPRSTNGIETDPVTFFHVIETIAKADASTAWCLSQAGGCAMSAAYLDLPVAQAIFGDPRAVLAWGPGPQGSRGRMRRRLQGYRRVVLCFRRPACDLARRALPNLRARWIAPIRPRWRSARAHHAGARRGRRMDRHLEHGRAARHRQRPVRPERFLRSLRSFDHPANSTGNAARAARSTA
ncbi:acyl-CoA dehydrogenase family protein [Bradyrhizobium sp. TZ2]